MIPHPVFDRRLDAARSVADVLLAPLEAAGIHPMVVDVGARNGNQLLPAQLSRRSVLVGFEPNPEEYAKLVAGTTDAERWLRSAGMAPVSWRERRYFPYALWNASERRDLYITRGPGACTLMGPTTNVARNIYYRYPAADPRRQQSLHDCQTEVISRVGMECRPLDELLTGGEVVDFLKIDVEGAELRVLQGADALLRSRRVLFVRAEFQVVPYYVEHTLLADQHKYLADRGFRLLDLEMNHRRYRRGATDLPDDSDRGLLLAGDALYSLDPDYLELTPLQLHRIAVIAFAFDLPGYGLSLIEQAGLLNPADLAALTTALKQPRPRSVQRRIMDAWMAIPVGLREAYRALSRSFK